MVWSACIILAVLVSGNGVALGSEEASSRESTIKVDRDVAYSLSYPTHWHPSGLTYANAFEVRNYAPKQPGTVPERNRASVIAIHTVNETADVTRRYFDGLEGQPFELDGRSAKRRRRRVGPETLGPGIRRLADADPAGGAPDHWSISTHVANGRVLLAIEGSVPITADAEIVEEILQIEDSMRFVNPEKNNEEEPQ